MAGMRDVVVHHYFDVDTDILWNTVQRSIPEAVAKITQARSEGRLP